LFSVKGEIFFADERPECPGKSRNLVLAVQAIHPQEEW
jgi:hypothetical protein